MSWRRFLITVGGVAVVGAVLHHGSPAVPAPDAAAHLSGALAHVSLAHVPAGWRASDPWQATRDGEVVGAEYLYLPRPGSHEEAAYTVCLSAPSDPAFCPGAGRRLVGVTSDGDGAYRVTVQRQDASGTATDRRRWSRLAVHGG